MIVYHRRLAEEHELLPVARLIGMHLRSEQDPEPVGQIAEALGISTDTALRSLRALEEKGWVRRVHSLWTSAGDVA